uniref:Uncharacterized protein n=1 Tax=Eutreptiella gymnastica TaxID=73025 RepID=A0A7S1I6C8_9EUGL|mmetsp:Transcript_133277/g.231179  ORF Transcript_133277/g.231179 Transcript_133277/m.231179 type:complete len:127 (+) Transcript_133277:69-449(+)
MHLERNHPAFPPPSGSPSGSDSESDSLNFAPASREKFHSTGGATTRLFSHLSYTTACETQYVYDPSSCDPLRDGQRCSYGQHPLISVQQHVQCMLVVSLPQTPPTAQQGAAVLEAGRAPSQWKLSS